MKVDFENIYKHIGFLFYALVAKENRLSQKDRLKLEGIIEKSGWIQALRGDSVLNKHLVDYICEGIRFAIENSMSTEHAMNSFRDYYTVHSLPFGQELKQKIIHSASAIVDEFPQRSHLDQRKEDLEALMQFTQHDS